MSTNFVTVKGKKYYINKGTLDLRDKGIIDIVEIKGLKYVKNLKKLDLSQNLIKEIKKLEHLTNLQKLHLFGNPITDEALADLMDEDAEFDAQKVVRYCQGKQTR